MGRTHLENHLLFTAQIEGLQMTAAAQIPDMHLMSIFASKQQVRLKSILNHVRRSPFAAQQHVGPQVPPEIVMQKLRSPIHFPLPEDLERLAIEHENTTRAVSIRRAKGTNIDSIRPAVNRMRT